VKKILWGLLALFVVVVFFIGIRYTQLRSASRLWEDPVEEILSEKLEKNADTMQIEFTSRIDAPLETVFAAFTEPERGQEFGENVRYSQLLQHEGNRKVVEFELVILGRPQRFILEFTFFPAEHLVKVKTVENQIADLTGEYRFTPSPDGTKTLLTYTGTSKDKIDLPAPLSFQKSALRETFVSSIRALKKGLVAQQNIEQRS